MNKSSIWKLYCKFPYLTGDYKRFYIPRFLDLLDGTHYHSDSFYYFKDDDHIGGQYLF